MSHFNVLVIGPKNEDELTEALMPFHEFECTGVEAYIQEIDITAECRGGYETSKSTCLVDPNGNIVGSRWSDEFLREPTPEEAERLGPVFGTCFMDGLVATSREGRTMVYGIPEGYSEVESPAVDRMTFAEHLEEDGVALVAPGESPDIEGNHKYRYALLDEDGNVVKVVRRTNPNKQWDWFVVGGRWKNKLLTRLGEKVDSCERKDLDVLKMRVNAVNYALEQYAKWTRAQEDLPEARTYKELDADGVPREKIHTVYSEQPRVKALERAGFRDFFEDILTKYKGKTIEDVSREASQSALSFFSIVDARQNPPVWHERGSMGWWGCVSDEKSADEWNEKVNELLDNLDMNTFLTVVDCHI